MDKIIHMHSPGQENEILVHASLMQLKLFWDWIWLYGELEFTLHKQDKTSNKTPLDGGFTHFNGAASRDILPRNSPKSFLEYQYGGKEGTVEIHLIFARDRESSLNDFYV